MKNIIQSLCYILLKYPTQPVYPTVWVDQRLAIMYSSYIRDITNKDMFMYMAALCSNV